MNHKRWLLFFWQVELGVWLCERLWFNRRRVGGCSCQSGRLVKQCGVYATERTDTSVKIAGERGEHHRTHVSERVWVTEGVKLCCSSHTNEFCPPPISPSSHSCWFWPWKSALSFVEQWKQSMSSHCHSPPLSPLLHFLSNRMLWIRLQRCVEGYNCSI